jgi:spectinomycin phosphotransferase
MLEHAEQYAGRLAARFNELVLCHTDIHPGNLFIDHSGNLFIIDWDYPKLALKECDLMFIGGGQGFVANSAKEEESLFYRGYGDPQLDYVALAYYRYERAVTDISVGERVLDPNRACPKEARQSLEDFRSGRQWEQAARRAFSIDREKQMRS